MSLINIERVETMEQSPSSGSSFSVKKLKKKQSKEERDKQKQAEKKKRRVEKAVAIATALRIELEKKKQKRKEEEQRLDEEGAALAEAVALQVLAEEDKGDSVGYSNFNEPQNADKVTAFIGPTECELQQLAAGTKEVVQNDIKLRGKNINCMKNFDHLFNNSISEGTRELREENVSDDKNSLCRSIQKSFKVSNASSKRVRDAELAASLAAARAVAALKIAEEARAEAEAVRIEAELSSGRRLESLQLPQLDAHLHDVAESKSAELERDELKVQVQEMKCALEEKNKKIIQLEQDLEYLKEYITQCKYLRLTSAASGCFGETANNDEELSRITVANGYDDSGDSLVG